MKQIMVNIKSLFIAENLYSFSKSCFFWYFWYFFHSFTCLFVVFKIEIFFSCLFVVFKKPYFENHEKTMIRLPKNSSCQKTTKNQLLLKEYKLSANKCSNCYVLLFTDSDESRVAAENVLNISREDIDFCDMLWNILHKSRSYDELKICLEKIFHHIKQEEFRPYVRSFIYLTLFSHMVSVRPSVRHKTTKNMLQR